MNHRSLLTQLMLVTSLVPLLLLLDAAIVFGSLHLAVRTVRSVHLRPRGRRS